MTVCIHLAGSVWTACKTSSAVFFQNCIIIHSLSDNIVQHAGSMHTACRHLVIVGWHHGKMFLKMQKGPLTWCLRDRPILGLNLGCKVGKAGVLALSHQVRVKAAGLNVWVHHVGIVRTSGENHACCHLVVN